MVLSRSTSFSNSFTLPNSLTATFVSHTLVKNPLIIFRYDTRMEGKFLGRDLGEGDVSDGSALGLDSCIEILFLEECVATP